MGAGAARNIRVTVAQSSQTNHTTGNPIGQHTAVGELYWEADGADILLRNAVSRWPKLNADWRDYYFTTELLAL
jgi:hypothetical protein